VAVSVGEISLYPLIPYSFIYNTFVSRYFYRRYIYFQCFYRRYIYFQCFYRRCIYFLLYSGDSVNTSLYFFLSTIEFISLYFMTTKGFWLIFKDIVVQCCPKRYRSFTFTYIADALFRKKTNKIRKKTKVRTFSSLSTPTNSNNIPGCCKQTHVITMVVYIF
jgi:hypothetical protein